MTESTRGGFRPGAGRKPADYVPPPETIEYNKAKARNEAAKADMAELDFRIKSGQYVDRAAVQQAGAMVLTTIAQALRTISDNLERKGVPVDVCVKVDEVINNVLAKAGEKLVEEFGTAAEDEDNSDLF